MKFEDYSRKFIHYYIDEISPLIENMMKERNGDTVIADIGCGDGTLLYALACRGLLDSVKQVYAIDLSEERVNNATKHHQKIQGLVADAMHIDKLSQESLDIILSNQVIEHVPNDLDMLKEMYRLLSKGGKVYLSTVFKKWYGWFFYKNRAGKWVIDPTHEREYTNDNELLLKITSVGFKISINRKTMQCFPITDFILKRIGFRQDIYQRYKVLKFLRKIRIPIIGYYNWELVLEK